MAGLLTNANYINNTIKPAIKSAIEAQGVTVPSTDSFLDYADRIGEIEGGGSGYQLKDLPTGAISTVNDAAPLPLNAFKVSVEAWQEGSGDPSPSNIRPIHGWSTATITVKDDLQNPTQTQTYTHAFTDAQGNPLTVYGAEWDVVDGRYINSIIYYEKTEVEYYGLYGDDNAPLFYFDVSGIKPYINDGDPVTIISNLYQSYPSLTSELMPNNCIRTRYSVAPTRIYFRDDRFTSKAEINAWLANNPLQVKCELITPTTIDLSPLSIRLLEGTNNIYADCGEVIEGEYFVDEGAIDVRKVDYQIGSSGSIKTTDGRVLSGFASMNGYHARPLDASGNWLDVDWSKSFEIGVAFKMTEYPGSNASQYIFGNGTNDLGYRFRTPRVYFSDYWQSLLLDMSLDGSSWYMDASVNFKPVLNTWYFIRLKFDLSTLRITLDIATDFETYTTLHTEVLSSGLYHNGSAIGIGGDQPTASDSTTDSFMVDTFNSYIKGDGVNWGASTGVFPS